MRQKLPASSLQGGARTMELLCTCSSRRFESFQRQEAAEPQASVYVINSQIFRAIKNLPYIQQMDDGNNFCDQTDGQSFTRSNENVRKSPSRSISDWLVSFATMNSKCDCLGKQFLQHDPQVSSLLRCREDESLQKTLIIFLQSELQKV